MANSLKNLDISSREVRRAGGVVILPLEKYQKLLERAVPTYYLKGRTASDLDRLVDKGLDEYRKGKTKKINSLADLDK